MTKEEERTELVVANETVAALDKAAANGLLAQKEVSQFKRAFMIAETIGELRNILTPKVMEPFMKLQNTSIGFKTDNPNGYPVDVVRDCVIEATLKGVYTVGNEFNIIQRQCYITKEGFGHKLKSIPNFGWMEIPSIPRINQECSGAVIRIRLEWSLNKQKFDKDLDLAIRVNRGMGPDAIIGKALRKARAWLFTAVTGQEVGDGEAEEAEIIDTTAEQEKKSPFEEAPKEENAKPEEQGNLPM